MSKKYYSPDTALDTDSDVESQKHQRQFLSPKKAKPDPHPTIIRRMEQGTKQSLDNLLSTNFASAGGKSVHQRYTTEMAPTLSPWMWWLLSCTLGIKHETKLTWFQVIVSKALHILTIGICICFGGFGLVVNVYEAMNINTNVSFIVLICVFKSAVGLSWIMLGIYSYYLAGRIFRNSALLKFVRVHSKTFMKISTSIWITMLSLIVIGANTYDKSYIWTNANQTNHLIDPTCASIELELTVCRVYFSLKTACATINSIWIMVVISVCFSVCRTHAIFIRRFSKELDYDFKVFEEFSKLQAASQQTPDEAEAEAKMEENEGMNDYDSFPEEASKRRKGGMIRSSYRKTLWTTLRDHRRGRMKSMLSGESKAVGRHENLPQTLETNLDGPGDNVTQSQTTGRIITKDGKGLKNTKLNGDGEPDWANMEAPIMSNQDILYNYSKMVKYLSTSARLFRRWVASCFVFAMMWCIFLVIYWTLEPALPIDIAQLLVPLLVFGLLVSAYAEVNLEGASLPKYILPTENRLAVIDYVNNRRLTMKVYTITLTYNVLSGFILSVVISVATKIIFKKMI